MECGMLSNSINISNVIFNVNNRLFTLFIVGLLKCPVSCGGGLRSRNVHCVAKDSRDLTQGCDRTTKPEMVTTCALNECPSSPGNETFTA